MAGRRWMWAAWLIACVLLWLFENNAASLSLLCGSLLLPAVSFLMAYRRGKTGRVMLSAPQTAAKHTSFPIVLSTEGTGFFYRVSGHVSCENRLTGERTETAFSLSSRLSGRTERTLTAEAVRCGTLRIRAEVWTEDLFGLWRSPVLPCEEELVTVEPELFLLQVTLAENTTVITDGEFYSQTRPGNDPSETFAIREYFPGDPIRQIHWKLSQKSDTMLLRELGLPVVNQTLLIFRNVLTEGETIPPEAADALAEVFLSVSHALLRSGCAHTLAFAEQGRYLMTEVQNEADFHTLKARFLTLTWEQEDGALTRVLSETPYAHVAVVSASMPPDAESFSRGNRVSVLTVSPQAAVSGLLVVSFTWDRYREELQYLEL